LSVAAHFIGEPDSRILVVSRRPAAPRGSAVLLVPPFGEEMNKTRRMYTDVAHGLMQRGIASVLPDLFGTGDSEGEFREATWDRWVRDISSTLAWTEAEGWPVCAVLATRLGCCLAGEAALASGAALRATVFWQPVADGSRFLVQLLRLRVAASMMEPGRNETAGSLRQRLRDGETLEVAGYEIAPRLAEQLEAVRLSAAIGRHLGVWHWMELVRDAQGALPAEAERSIAQARASGLEPTVRTIAGEPFWASTEIVRNAELTRATLDALCAAA